MRSRFALWLGVPAALGFLVAALSRGDIQAGSVEGAPAVVLPAPIQALLYFGDRYLAANIESIRAAASGIYDLRMYGGFRLRAHRVVSQLNGCHEDNYWIGNAVLSWGGAVDDGFELLARASRCRYWDEMPPFLYGFNLRFFKKDLVGAREGFEEAARRATGNAAGFRSMAIMLSVNSEKDVEVALKMLSAEIETTGDEKLKGMLRQRAKRLEGLLELRRAQARFEQQRQRPLSDPKDLIRYGYLVDFPVDPLKIGYVFQDGRFELGQIKVLGMN